MATYPQRIVCLAAEAPAILDTLGRMPSVVGVSAFATEPPAVRTLPRIGGFSTPNLQKILDLQPDLVITLSDIQAKIAGELIQHGVPVLALNPHRLDDIWQSWRMIGGAVGAEQAAAQAIDTMQARIRELGMCRADAPRPKVYFEEWHDPMISGIGWVSDLIEAAGGNDIFRVHAEQPHAGGRVIDPAAVIAAAPEIIIASWCGKPADLDALCARPGWAEIPAVRAGHVYEIDSSRILQIGPELCEGAAQLARLIQGTVIQGAVGNPGEKSPEKSPVGRGISLSAAKRANDTATAPQEQMTQLIGQIVPPDREAMVAAQSRQSRLTKPAGALGRLETLAIQLAGITGSPAPELKRKAILVAAADHGVCAEGVSPYPQAVTAQMVGNFLAGGAAINVLARNVGARVIVLDLGLAHPLPDSAAVATAAGSATRFVAHPIAPGTANLAVGPAMDAGQAWQSIHAGATAVQAEIEIGLDVLGLGEMGIGNTTAAAAVACALSGVDPAAMVGRGAGLDDAGLAHKIAVVRRGLAVNGLDGTGNVPPQSALEPSAPQMAFALRVLGGVGGFEIGGLTGAILAAAAQRVPVVVDGFIATAAAMLAVQIAPVAREFLIPAHRSAEPGHGDMLAWLELEPYLALDMRLGEGTGAALAMGLIDAAWQTLRDMATFAEAGVTGKAEI